MAAQVAMNAIDGARQVAEASKLAAVVIDLRRVLLGKSCGWPALCPTVLLRGYQRLAPGAERKTKQNGSGVSYHIAICGRVERSKRTLTFVAMRGGSPNPQQALLQEPIHQCVRDGRCLSFLAQRQAAREKVVFWTSPWPCAGSDTAAT